MKKLFNATFFQQNRQRLLDDLSDDCLVVLTAGGLQQRSTDTTHPFQQDGSFWYFCGVDEPNVLLVFGAKASYLIVPELSAAREAFDGAIDPEALKAYSGVDEVLSITDGWERLKKQIKSLQHVATLQPPDAYIEQLGMYTNPARTQLFERLKAITPKLKTTDLRTIVGRMRMVKQPAEQAAIRQAISITLAGIDKVQQCFENRKYETELEIELDLTKAFYQNGGTGHSFDPIVAGGLKAATIHPTGNYQTVDYNRGMLLDVGAYYQHYAADISRTIVPAGHKRYQTVYEAVQAVAAQAMDYLKPGVMMREYEQAVEGYMGEQLRRLGLIKKLDRADIRRYFPHATSHFLGIDVHDTGDYELPLSEGVVLAVEPGIYIPEEGIGVRIEDNVLITAKGCLNLSSG